jgi:rhomboid protease GluP
MNSLRRSSGGMFRWRINTLNDSELGSAKMPRPMRTGTMLGFDILGYYMMNDPDRSGWGKREVTEPQRVWRRQKAWRWSTQDGVAADYRAPRTLWLLAGLLLAIETVLQLADHGVLPWTGLRSTAVAYGAYWDFLFPPGKVDQALYPGQAYVMLVSYGLLHGGSLHVIMNTVVLFGLGKTLSFHLGIERVLATFLVGVVSGAILFGLLADTAQPMLGASGGVFALLGLWMQWQRLQAQEFGRPVRSTLSTLLGLILIHLVLGVFLGDSIAWQAHFGGFAMGYWVMAWALPDRTR